MDATEVRNNVINVKARVAAAAARREKATGVSHSVTLLAATKTVAPELINAAIKAGITDVGENRVQEYIAKKDAVKGAKQHFIGTLQRNKAKYLVGEVELIQSVSDVALAAEIDRLAKKRNVVQKALVELNVGDEEGKTGARPCDFAALIKAVRAMENVELCGMMAVLPIAADDKLYDMAYDAFKTHFDVSRDILSMGMSGDYEKAIEHGSNMVRVGTGLFGAR